MVKLHKGKVPKKPVRVKIREMEIGDIESVWNMGEEQFLEIERLNWDWTPESIGKYLDPEEGFGFVAEKNGDVAGFILVEYNWSLQKRRAGSIEWIMVNKKYRNIGIGTQLIKRALTKLRRNGMKEVIATIWSKNKPSLKTFNKMEFKTRGKLIFKSRKL